MTWLWDWHRGDGNPASGSWASFATLTVSSQREPRAAWGWGSAFLILALAGRGHHVHVLNEPWPLAQNGGGRAPGLQKPGQAVTGLWAPQALHPAAEPEAASPSPRSGGTLWLWTWTLGHQEELIHHPIGCCWALGLLKLRLQWQPGQDALHFPLSWQRPLSHLQDTEDRDSSPWGRSKAWTLDLTTATASDDSICSVDSVVK